MRDTAVRFRLARAVASRGIAVIGGIGAGLMVLETIAAIGLADFGFIAGIEAGRTPAVHGRSKRIEGELQGDLARVYQLAGQRAYRIDARIDARGFRNPVDLDTAEVAILGDSFVENPLVADADNLAPLLALELGTSVVNLGRSGFGPQHELAVLRSEVAALRPSIVIWVFFEGNDLNDLRTMDGARPRQFVDRSLLRNLVVWLEDSFPRGRFEPPRCSFESTTGSPTEVYFGFRPFPLDAVALADVRSLTSILDLAARETRRLGVRFVLAYAPAKFRVLKGSCRISEDNPAHEWEIGDLPERIRAFAEAKQIDFIDFTPALQRATGTGSLVYFPDDTHWNAAGVRVAVEELARLLRVQHNEGGPRDDP